MSAHAIRPQRLPGEAAVAAGLLAAALGAWLVTVTRMEGMDHGPGTDPGALGWYVGVWVTMMAAMMLPSVAPMMLLFRRVNRGRAERQGRRGVPLGVFLAGYLAAWTAYGLAAYGLYRGAVALRWDFLAWERGGRYLAAGAVAAAGVYQLTPLKSVCLKHCRGPMHFLLNGWRDGWRGALRMGAEHGGYCVGCCWGLMVVLWAVGMMSVAWMVAIAALILVEKVSPIGERLTPVLAAALIGLGAWIAVSPGSVPALAEPSSASHMEHEMGTSPVEKGMGGHSDMDGESRPKTHDGAHRASSMKHR